MEGRLRTLSAEGLDSARAAIGRFWILRRWAWGWGVEGVEVEGEAEKVEMGC